MSKRVSLRQALSEPETQVIVVRDSTFVAWARDVFTFGCIGGLAWLNHTQMGGSWVIDLLVIVSVFTMSYALGSGRRTTVKGLREMLDAAEASK